MSIDRDVSNSRHVSSPFAPPTPEELARRRAAIDEIRRMRQEIGPIGLSLEELLGEEDPGDDG